MQYLHIYGLFEEDEAGFVVSMDDGVFYTPSATQPTYVILSYADPSSTDGISMTWAPPTA